MSNTFFIADPHFDDDNIRRYENRPFENVGAMNEAMIARCMCAGICPMPIFSVMCMQIPSIKTSVPSVSVFAQSGRIIPL